ncbi:hypothetical protein HZS_1640 [Henneguya salminicola]|nr:hypothetical protein HZS_1640 [Henneguya salminicola]
MSSHKSTVGWKIAVLKYHTRLNIIKISDKAIKECKLAFVRNTMKTSTLFLLNAILVVALDNDIVIKNVLFLEFYSIINLPSNTKKGCCTSDENKIENCPSIKNHIVLIKTDRVSYCDKICNNLRNPHHRRAANFKPPLGLFLGLI